MTGGYPLEQLESSAQAPLGSPAEMIMRATAEAESIRELARSEGLAQGHEAGLVEAGLAAGALRAALEELGRQTEELVQSIERDAVEFALTLAAKLLSGALDVQPERVLDTVAGALRRITERRRITIFVDPADLEIVNGAIGRLASEAGGIELCEVQADRRVGRGGAIVRTAESEVDLTVQTQLDRAREIIAAELDGEASGP